MTSPTTRWSGGSRTWRRSPTTRGSEHEAAWPVFLREVSDFLAADRAPGSPDADVSTLLSPRELDVLGLAAEGADNDAIAARLHLSVRTVERHLQNVYAKLGLRGRNARAAAVARLLTRV